MTLDGYRILQPKGKRRDIMVLDSFSLWSYLNLVFFSYEKQKEIDELSILFKATTYFKYWKIEKQYWTGKYLFDQSIGTDSEKSFIY